jgi:hypothetical protein
VVKAIQAFPAGSSGGPDGLRPQHISDLLGNKESGPSLATALTAFVNLLLSGVCPAEIVPLLFGGRLIALQKKTGGLRPIVVGFTLRRLAAKCANIKASASLANYFTPRQLGVGLPGGCEAAIHATRRFIQTMPSDYVVAKLDFSNAFNCLHRDTMLKAVLDKIPEHYRFCHLSYNNASILFFGTHTLLSEEGTQQGDPLGPLFLSCSSTVAGLFVVRPTNRLYGRFHAGWAKGDCCQGCRDDCRGG